MTMNRNDTLFERAQRTIPAGVNSPVRAFRSVGGTPRFLARGEGPYVWDADGKRYVDYVGSWGPAIVGHAHPDVVRAVIFGCSPQRAVGACSLGTGIALTGRVGGLARRASATAEPSIDCASPPGGASRSTSPSMKANDEAEPNR